MNGYVFVAGEGEEAELFGVGDTEALVEHCVRDGEDGGVGTDSKGERAYSDGGEARAFAEDTGGVAEVAPEIVPPAEAKGGAHFVFVRGDGTEFEAGLTSGFVCGKTLAHEIDGARFEMKLHLIVHVGFETATT